MRWRRSESLCESVNQTIPAFHLVLQLGSKGAFIIVSVDGLTKAHLPFTLHHGGLSGSTFVLSFVTTSVIPF